MLHHMMNVSVTKLHQLLPWWRHQLGTPGSDWSSHRDEAEWHTHGAVRAAVQQKQRRENSVQAVHGCSSLSDLLHVHTKHISSSISIWPFLTQFSHSPLRPGQEASRKQLRQKHGGSTDTWLGPERSCWRDESLSGFQWHFVSSSRYICENIIQKWFHIQTELLQTTS